MDIHIENIEKELVDDFGESYNVASIISGDIYRHNEPFGYFHAAWKNSERKLLNLVVHAITENSDTLAIILIVDLASGGICVAEAPTEFYDSDWCKQSNVVFASEVNNFSKAQDSFEVAHYLVHELPDLKRVIANNA